MMTTDEFRSVVNRLGGVRAAARALGMSKSTISNLKTGKKPVSSTVCIAIRMLSVQRGEVSA
jgi:DNA-binding transcriptional regulator YdaS (Cro superfamily)